MSFVGIQISGDHLIPPMRVLCALLVFCACALQDASSAASDLRRTMTLTSGVHLLQENIRLERRNTAYHMFERFMARPGRTHRGSGGGRARGDALVSRLFTMFDINGNNSIDSREFRSVLRMLRVVTK